MNIFPHCLNIATILLLISFTKILNDDCKFRDEKGNIVPLIKDNLNEFKTHRDKKIRCFSFSNSFVQTEKCCYNNTSQTCVIQNSENDNDTLVECPNKSQIYNNCGKSGIYEPEDSIDCTEISLVRGYCCYVKFKNHGSSCLRTNILNKEKNSTTEQMKNYIKKIDVTAEVEKVICKGYYLKYSFFFIIIFLFIY